jgi:hypothetical protein
MLEHRRLRSQVRFDLLHLVTLDLLRDSQPRDQGRQ